MLVLGCGTELPLQLSRDGYGTRRVTSVGEVLRELGTGELEYIYGIIVFHRRLVNMLLRDGGVGR